MKALVAGWFSFEWMGATAGDLMARDVVCRWLDRAGVDYDIALSPAFAGGVDWRTVGPEEYSHVLFVCGPFGNGEPITDFLDRFSDKKLVGVDLSMLQPVDEWNPFDLLLERDSSRAARPDLSFAFAAPLVPVIGLVLVHDQAEYKKDSRHSEANDAIERLTKHREMAVVLVDTSFDPENQTGFRTPAEVESVISKMDVVVTTRLHGMVLALKNGVPALAIDPVAGGAKIGRQAETIGWSVVFTGARLIDSELQEAFEYCLTEEARSEAARCRSGALAAIREAEVEFQSVMTRWKKGS